jgi:transglutaminase-like putative cysteine protease
MAVTDPAGSTVDGSGRRPTPGSRPIAEVGCLLDFDVLQDSELALQLAPASSAGTVQVESLEVTGVGGTPLPAVEVAVAHGGRVHLVEAPVGRLRISYQASILTAPTPGSATSGPGDEVDRAEALVYGRPSRYCPSDVLVGWALAELGGDRGPGPTARGAASWVFEQLAYVGGTSRPTDSAVDTLLARAGVCRDFAHLTIAACRALGIPARLVAAYAPGLTPMDFHAVVEVAVDGTWEVLDPTRLAPRTSLVRIATGRDAADTAFASTVRGDVELVSSEVFASTDRVLEVDDHERAVHLP